MTMAVKHRQAARAQAFQEMPARNDRAPCTPRSAGNQARLRGLAVRGQRLQARLTVGAVNDPLEREADAAADRVMRMAGPQVSLSSAPTLSRTCAACEEEEQGLQREAAGGGMVAAAAPPIVHDVLNSPGRPLDPATHDFMAGRFGADFGDVRIHADSQAARSAAAVDALAYTVGRDVVFASGQYDPGGDAGRRLLAHELAHVVQQGFGDRGHLRRMGDPSRAPAVLSCTIASTSAPGDREFVLFSNRGTSLSNAEKMQISNYVDRYHESGSSAVVRVDGFASQPGDDSLNWLLSCSRAVAVKDELVNPSAAQHPGLPEASIDVFMHGETAEFGDDAQNRRAAISPSIEGSQAPPPEPTPPARDMTCFYPGCPEDFCRPFPTQEEALADRASDGESVLSIIALANSHAEPLFRNYVFSPGPAGDISTEYASDFSSSRTTRYVSEQIHPLVEADISSHPPAFPPDGGWMTVDYETDPGKAALKQEFNRLATDGLVFSNYLEVPGLIAGGIGTDQASCKVGADTSGAQEDSRSARVSAQVFRNPDGTLVINPVVYYTVVDTIDFCPGNCGGFFAQNIGKTVQMSRWEASGISGDVPFTVIFQGPSLIGAYNSEDG
jgi:outer membrane protein OmpA-like peptidoglycan-associated protein